MTLDHKAARVYLQQWPTIHCMGQNYNFFMPKIIRILSRDHDPWKFPTVNISKKYFWLVICIAKDFIWTIFRFFAPSDYRGLFHKTNLPNKSGLFLVSLTYFEPNWQIRLTEINLACLVNLFYETGPRFSNSCISAKYCPNKPYIKSLESLFIQLSDDV